MCSLVLIFIVGSRGKSSAEKPGPTNSIRPSQCELLKKMSFLGNYGFVPFIHIYNTIQYKNEYYYSGINPVEFRGHIFFHLFLFVFFRYNYLLIFKSGIPVFTSMFLFQCGLLLTL